MSDTPSNATAGGGRLDVLLVDDQQFVGIAVKHMLASERDIVIHFCPVAADAIAHANRLAPCVIFQDLMMPGIDGLTLVGMYRGNSATATTPIVVLSGNDDASSRASAAAAGADDYLVKLPAKSALIECIRRHAAGRASSAGTSTAPGTESSSAA